MRGRRKLEEMVRSTAWLMAALIVARNALLLAVTVGLLWAAALTDPAA